MTSQVMVLMTPARLNTALRAVVQLDAVHVVASLAEKEGVQPGVGKVSRVISPW